MSERKGLAPAAPRKTISRQQVGSLLKNAKVNLSPKQLASVWAELPAEIAFGLQVRATRRMIARCRSSSTLTRRKASWAYPFAWGHRAWAHLPVVKSRLDCSFRGAERVKGLGLFEPLILTVRITSQEDVGE